MLVSGKQKVTENIWNRGGLDSCVEFLQSLDLKKHSINLYKTPFRVLFQKIIDGNVDPNFFWKNTDDIKKVLTAFNPKTRTLNIGSRSVVLTEDFIRDLLGIVDGKSFIDIKSGQKITNVKFTERNYPEHYVKKTMKLTKAMIEARLKEQNKAKSGVNSNDFAANTILYLLAEGLLPNKAENIGWKYIDFVTDFEKSVKFNWSKRIFHSLLTVDVGEETHSGCLQILLVRIILVGFMI